MGIVPEGVLEMPSKRTILSIMVLAAVVCALGLAVRLCFFTPTQQNYRRAQYWIDQSIDMPYQDGFTLNSAMYDLYHRLRRRGMRRVGMSVLRGDHAESKADSPIHYSSHDLPLSQSLTELLRPLGLGYRIEAEEDGVFIRIRSMEKIAELDGGQ